MQQAIKQYPNSIDFRQCHYFVTDLDIARSLGKDIHNLAKKDIDLALEGLGLDLEKEVYDMPLKGETIAFLVPENALRRIGAELLPWDQSLRGANRGAESRGVGRGTGRG
jgi:hypothetical protein